MESESLSIGDAARKLGVHPDTLRRWEASGRVVAGRTPSGQRRFTVAELARVRAEMERGA